jgi:hypothetical protein
MTHFVLMLALSSGLSNDPIPACDPTTAIVDRARSIHYPIIELRSDAWGAVVVAFKLLPDGTTTDLEPVQSSSILFERAAIMLVSESRFSRSDDACKYSLLIEFTMNERAWSTEVLPAPENLDKHYEELKIKHEFLYGS